MDVWIGRREERSSSRCGGVPRRAVSGGRRGVVITHPATGIGLPVEAGLEAEKAEEKTTEAIPAPPRRAAVAALLLRASRAAPC